MNPCAPAGLGAGRLQSTLGTVRWAVLGVYRPIHNLEVISSSTSLLSSYSNATSLYSFYSYCALKLWKGSQFCHTYRIHSALLLFFSMNLLCAGLGGLCSLEMFQSIPRLTTSTCRCFLGGGLILSLCFALAAAALLIEATCSVACPLVPKAAETPCVALVSVHRCLRLNSFAGEEHSVSLNPNWFRWRFAELAAGASAYLSLCMTNVPCFKQIEVWKSKM